MTLRGEDGWQVLKQSTYVLLAMAGQLVSLTWHRPEVPGYLMAPH